MSSILPLILSLAVFPLVSAQPWYGVFWSPTEQAWLNNTFEQRIQISPNDTSFNHLECQHTTIAFNPPQSLVNVFTPLLTTPQSARILAYAHDEHGQAILLHYQNSTGGQALIPTQNSFPHTTISHQNSYPYTAVYSNDLWSRVNQSGFVNITFGDDGKPAAIQFADGKTPVNNQLQFPLPAITLGTNNYTATIVNVTLIDPNQYILNGTFCVNSSWSDVQNLCSVPTAAPTTVAPTTLAPTTVAPTTATPTTPTPSNTTNTTTIAPTTVAPTTASPTTPTPSNKTTLAPNSTTTSPNTTQPPTSTPKPGNTTAAPNTGVMNISFNGITMVVGAIIMLAFL